MSPKESWFKSFFRQNYLELRLYVYTASPRWLLMLWVRTVIFRHTRSCLTFFTGINSLSMTIHHQRVFTHLLSLCQNHKRPSTAHLFPQSSHWQKSVQGKAALLQLHRLVEQSFLQPHLTNSVMDELCVVLDHCTARQAQSSDPLSFHPCPTGERTACLATRFRLQMAAR